MGSCCRVQLTFKPNPQRNHARTYSLQQVVQECMLLTLLLATARDGRHMVHRSAVQPGRMLWRASTIPTSATQQSALQLPPSTPGMPVLPAPAPASSVHACSWACPAFLGTHQPECVLNTVGAHSWAAIVDVSCKISIGKPLHLLTRWQGAASWRLSGLWGHCRAAPLLSRRSWSPHHPPPPPV